MKGRIGRAVESARRPVPREARESWKVAGREPSTEERRMMQVAKRERDREGYDR